MVVATAELSSRDFVLVHLSGSCEIDKIIGDTNHRLFYFVTWNCVPNGWLIDIVLGFSHNHPIRHIR